jgi:hypothetical protein
MSGVRHHILPRFLLKGFTNRSTSKDVYTNYCRKGTAIVEANIKNIGVEKNFYGKEGEASVDGDITELEGKFSTVIANLRKLPTGSNVSDSGVVEFIVHLTARTKHLRDSIIDSADDFLEAFSKYFDNENISQAWINDYYRRNPQELENSLNESLRKTGLPRSRRLFLKRRIKKIPRKDLMSLIHNEIPEVFRELNATIEIFRKDLPQRVRESHLRILAKSLVPEPRLNSYKQLRWTNIHSERLLILGDIGCLFRVVGKDKLMPTASIDDEIINVFLPVSSSVLIVGSASGEDSSFVDVETLNEQFAVRSREFFVSASINEETHRLHKVIGNDFSLVTNDEIQTMLREVAFGEARPE